jgi:hypothetical protein
MDKLELTTILQDPASATRRLLSAWSNVPLLLMLDVDWSRGPLVFIGLSDQMMSPLLPPGSLLQLNQKVRTVTNGLWTEFERPVYLIECGDRFYCCHAQRQGETLLLISHDESPSRCIIRVPVRETKVRGQVIPIFRPLTPRNTPAGHATGRRK